VRIYELYTAYPGGAITNLTKNYHSGMWIAKVRANNVRQAYALLSQQVVAQGSGGGIVSLDNSFGPISGWPWKSRELYPKHWGEML